MSTSEICRLCGFNDLELSFELKRMPRFNHRLLKPHELKSDVAIDLKISRCLSCGFISLPVNLTSDYYDDYINIPSQSMQARQFQMMSASEFVRKFDLSDRKVLEVGCGDGFFLHALTQASAIPFGIEPSSAQRDQALKYGVQVESGILAGGRVLAAAPFDAFVSRQVFEHVDDMRDFLLTIRGNLAPGAVGMLEVPNLDVLVEGSRFFDFIPEHINYFNPQTLTLAMQLAGFEVLDVLPVDNGESLRVLVKNPKETNFHRLTERVGSLRDDMKTFLIDCKERGKKVAVWGAGGKGVSMMAVVDLEDVAILVDASPEKLGLLTPVSHLTVTSPSEIEANGIDAIVIMAPAYEREIASKLRNELRFKGDIVLAGSGFTRLGVHEEVQ